jgi:hypothetical protein
MAEDYSYSGAAPSGAQEAEPPHDESKEHEDSEQTALLPKSILQGKEFKPGDEVVLKIEEMYEDDFLVSYATEPAKESTGMDKAKSDLAGYAKES